VPALWRYCTEEWLTLRTPAAHAVSARWPLDRVWIGVQGLLGTVQEGQELVWREADEASELRVLTILQGSLTSWAAMWGLDDLEQAAGAMVGRVERYLAGRDRTFAMEVRRKRARLGARGVRWDGLDGGRGARLRRHCGARRRASSHRAKGRRPAARRPAYRRTRGGGESI